MLRKWLKFQTTDDLEKAVAAQGQAQNDYNDLTSELGDADHPSTLIGKAKVADDNLKAADQDVKDAKADVEESEARVTQANALQVD